MFWSHDRTLVVDQLMSEAGCLTGREAMASVTLPFAIEFPASGGDCFRSVAATS